MTYIIYRKRIAFFLLSISIVFLSIGQYADAADDMAAGTRRIRTYDTGYQSADSGRYRNNSNSALWNQINALASKPVVQNIKIPVLLGVSVTNLEDTWQDARSLGRTHEGIDIMSPKGTPVVSPTDAIVTTVENSGLGGNHVFTANPGGQRYYFAHLDSFAPGLSEGQALRAGDLIGYVGNTGNASGGATHLHFGIYENDRLAINPFSRLTLEFSLQERINSVATILNRSADPTALARLLVSSYRSIFIQAQSAGMSLPLPIAQALAEKVAAATAINRTLKIGMRGDDVRIMQESLGIMPADGIFGPKTRASVMLFQSSHNLNPDGVFGPLSRAALY